MGSILATLSGCMTVNPQAAIDEITQESVHRLQLSLTSSSIDQRTFDLLAQPLGANAALELFLLRNPKLQVRLSELGLSQLELAQSVRLKNPILDVDTRFGADVNIELKLLENVYDLLLLSKRTAFVEGMFQVEKGQALAEVLMLAGQFRTVFLEYQQAEALYRTETETRRAMDQAQEIAHRLYKAGNINELDLAKAEMKVVEGRLLLSSYDLQRKTVRKRLEEMLAIPDAFIARWTAESLSTSVPECDPEFQLIEKEAYQARPEMTAISDELNVQMKKAGIAQLEQLSSASAAGVSAERDPSGEWLVGPALQIPLPLFDSGTIADQAAQQRLKILSGRYQAMQLQIRSEVRQAIDALIAAREQAATVREQLLPLKQKVLEQVQLHYNGMFLSVFDLLDAKIELLKGRYELAKASFTYWQARAALDQAAGKILPQQCNAQKSTETK